MNALFSIEPGKLDSLLYRSAILCSSALGFLIAALMVAPNAAATPCNPTAMLEGDTDVLAPIALTLKTNGVSTTPSIGCPAG